MPAKHILMSVGYIEYPYDYGGLLQTGYLAFPVAWDGQRLRLVRHTVRSIEVVELTADELARRYMPDLSRTPPTSAKAFRSLRTFMQTTLEARELIDQVFRAGYDPKEFPVAAPKKQPAVKNQKVDASVYIDVNRRTCIKLAEADGVVQYIPLLNEGFDVERADAQDFHKEFKELSDYPIDRAARLYVEYSLNLGGTKQAMQALAQLTKVTDKEFDMATTKAASRAAKKETTKKAAEPAKKTAAKTSAPAKAADQKTVDQKTVDQKTAAKKATAKTSGPSAAQRFRDLILAGKLSDDKIFETVQKEFGLDDSKRGYVKWYRNDLVKKGLLKA